VVNCDWRVLLPLRYYCYAAGPLTLCQPWVLLRGKRIVHDLMITVAFVFVFVPAQMTVMPVD
jgi:hypothetical protein